MENLTRIEAGILVFLIIFVIIFLGDYFFVKRKYLKKKKKGKKQELMEASYLAAKFKLNQESLINKKMLKIFSMINAFIIAIVCVTVLVIDCNVILKLVIGFILLIALIYAIYEILGRYLERNLNNGK